MSISSNFLTNLTKILLAANTTTTTTSTTTTTIITITMACAGCEMETLLVSGESALMNGLVDPKNNINERVTVEKFGNSD